MFSLICNVSIQNTQAAAFLFQLMNGCPWETVQCFVAENCGSYGVGGGHQNLQPHDKFSTNWNLNYQDQMLSTSCFSILWWKEIFRVFICGVNIQNDTSALATAFILTDVEWMILRIFFLWQKCLTSRRVSTQNLRIHAECSAIWSGFWPILVPDRIKSVQNTLSQRTGRVILWSAACNPILHIFTGTFVLTNKITILHVAW